MRHKRPVETIEDAANIVRNTAPDFTFNADVMTDEDARVRRLKWVMTHKLTTEERNLLLLEIEVQSSRRIGTMLGFSKNTILPELRRIKAKVIAEYDKIKDKEI